MVGEPTSRWLWILSFANKGIRWKYHGDESSMSGGGHGGSYPV